ncbi:MAG TPA: cation transporter [Ignavibacteria bacterium]|nr:cation transporter [Ignavibacteria bacterium]HMR40267.1 cation transporter [Ignavibacteria bacterium]
MTHTYQVSGMTCGSCVKRVQKALSEVKGVENANVTLDPPSAEIKMKYHINENVLSEAIEKIGDYRLGSELSSEHHSAPALETESVSKFTTYKPLIIVFIYILLGVILLEVRSENFNLLYAMNNFMAGFFLVFSFFKMLDLTNFASSYSSYDIIARKWYGYGFIYPFIELALGIMYLLQVYPVVTNVLTVIVMGISSVGVIQSVVQKRTIQCACLGAVFNLPMSTITIIEDLLMAAMALIMLLLM